MHKWIVFANFMSPILLHKFQMYSRTTALE
jgi:hypothetical protein